MKKLFAAVMLSFSMLASASDIITGYSPCWAGRACALDIVVHEIEQSKPGQPLLMAAYGLTSKPVAEALIAANARGVKVRVLADAKSNRRKFSIAQVLANRGIPVRLNDRYAIMHNKFMVIGSDTVQTGSFNYTQAAAKSNAENVIVIHGDREVVRQYTAEWNRLWDEGDPVVRSNQ